MCIPSDYFKGLRFNLAAKYLLIPINALKIHGGESEAECFLHIRVSNDI